jgi:hypothetical protein
MIGHNILLCLLFILYARFGRWNPMIPPKKQRTPAEAASA